MRALPALALVAGLGALARWCGGRGMAEPPLFEDVRAAWGLAGERGAHVSFADLNADGLPDAAIDRTRIFLNRGDRFERAAGIPAEVGRADSVQFGDLDGDGFADAFLGRYEGVNDVFLGDGAGGFRRVPAPGLAERCETTISSCFVDVDADGALDVFVAAGYVAYGTSLEAHPSRLYRGRGDGTFEDVTERAGLLGVAAPGTPASRRPTYGVAHTDWNNDGRQDLIACSYGRQANRLWRNDGGGRFTDVAPEIGFDGDEDRSGTYAPEVKARLGVSDEPAFRAHGNTFDAAVADCDSDGDMDVFLAEIAHWWAGPSSDRSTLLLNLGPAAGFRFARRPDLLPPRPRATARWNEGDRHAGWLDVDNDGRLDLLIASSDYPDDQMLRLYRQRPSGDFEDWTGRLGFRWLNASQISLADFDRDGATDILVATNDVRLTPERRARHDLSVGLFRNRAAAASGNRFLSLRLRGRGGRPGSGGSNRDAVGARVTIVLPDGSRQTREVHGGLGHAGHRDDAECRFGVGRWARVDRLEVRWPNAAGAVQVFRNVAAGRFYLLEEGGDLRAIP